MVWEKEIRITCVSINSGRTSSQEVQKYNIMITDFMSSQKTDEYSKIFYAKSRSLMPCIKR